MADGADLTLVSKSAMNHPNIPEPDKATNHKQGAESDPLRRPRGRPTGSKNKPKPPIIVTRDSTNTLRAHAIEVSSGCDVSKGLTSFARRKQCGVSVFSATGCVTNVTLRQPGSSGIRGHCDPPRAVCDFITRGVDLATTGSTRAYNILGRAQGQVVGGGVVGALVASGPVVIMSATFMNATFERLPPLDDHEAAQSHHQQYQNGCYHMDHVSDICGVSQNLLTKGSLPPDIYSWAPGRTLSKT